MMMLFPKLSALLATLALASARDTGKFMKTVPTISNSLVNLGKMEISFHFNGKHPDMPQAMSDSNIHSDFYNSPPAEESCPCNNFKPPSFLSDPSEIVNKILKSNDLFKDPTSSICCESAEHLQESTVVFELNPTNNIPSYNAPRNTNIVPQYSNILPRGPIFSNFIPLTSVAGSKPKTVEIFMYPKKNDMAGFDLANFLRPRKTKDSSVAKSDLQVIKDGGINMKPSTSVKKDLTLLEKKDTEESVELHKDELQTDAPPVTNVNNTL